MHRRRSIPLIVNSAAARLILPPWAALVAGLWLFAAPATAQVNEYQVKAAFLFNFARFVEWPAHTFQRPGDPIVICVLGQNPFGDILNQTVAGKAVAGRTFEVRYLSASPSLHSLVHGCQILYVAAPDSKKFGEISGGLKDSGVLSVGEAPEILAYGGIIAFKLEHGNIRLEINVAAAESAQVRISSKLLSLAQVVGRTP